jgi:hypothetical protein
MVSLMVETTVDEMVSLKVEKKVGKLDGFVVAMSV